MTNNPAPQSHPFVGLGKSRRPKNDFGSILEDFDIKKIANGVQEIRGRVYTPKEIAEIGRTSKISPQEILYKWRRVTALLINMSGQEPLRHSLTSSELGWGIDRVRDLAIHGDEVAMSAYGSFIWKLVHDLECLAHSHPNVVRKWSRTCSEIPVLAGKGPRDEERLKLRFEAFQVGEDGDFQMKPSKRGRGMSNDSAANRIVRALCSRMNYYRTLGAYFDRDSDLARKISKLPKFSTATWDKWAEVGWLWVMQMTANKPEIDSTLRPLGKSAGDKSNGGRSAESFIRHKIKEILKNSFKGMAPAEVGSPDK